MSNKSKMILETIAILGLLIGGVCFKIGFLMNLFTLLSIVILIISLLHIFGDGGESLAKGLAKSRLEGDILSDFVNTIIWLVIILTPAAYGYIFCSICWLVMFVLIYALKDRIQSYYEKYKSGELRPE